MGIDLWFATFLILQSFNSVPHTVVNPNHEIILLLLHNCNFATILNHNVNIWYVEYLICDFYEVNSIIVGKLFDALLSSIESILLGLLVLCSSERLAHNFLSMLDFCLFGVSW